MEVRESSPDITLLVGATTNPDRYAFMAAQLLDAKGLNFIPIGIKKGRIFGREILQLQAKPFFENIHTITLYLGPINQMEWIDYLIELKPKRIIFNPGTENPEFFRKLLISEIKAVPACTLVMLQTNQYL